MTDVYIKTLGDLLGLFGDGKYYDFSVKTTHHKDPNDEISDEICIVKASHKWDDGSKSAEISFVFINDHISSVIYGKTTVSSVLNMEYMCCDLYVDYVNKDGAVDETAFGPF